MANIKVINLNKRKKVSAGFIRKLAEKAIKKLRLGKKNINLNIVFVRDKYIRELNKIYKRRDRPTDVLCFSMRWKKHLKDKGRREADIYISSDTAQTNAKRFETIFLHEIYLYVIHGILHIAGFKDTGPGARKKMKNAEESLLAEIVYGQK